MSISKNSRRSFLLQSISTLSVFAASNAGVYVVGSAFKNLDGNLAAGAKTWTMLFSFAAGETCPNTPDFACPPTLPGPCAPLGDEQTANYCGCGGGIKEDAFYRCQ